MGLRTLLKQLFAEEPDPLDDLLRAKGIDPQQLLIDLKLKRSNESAENTINRAIGRCTAKQEAAQDKIRNMMSN